MDKDGMIKYAEKKKGERYRERKTTSAEKNIDRLTQKATLPNLTRETPKRKRKNEEN